MFALILHGKKKSIELQKWRNSRILVKLFQNASAFSNSSSSVIAGAADVSPPQDLRKVKTFTVSYLVDSLGLTTKLAESISRKISSEGKGNNPDSVLNLFRSHGFTDSQISSIIANYPRLLVLDAEKSLGPKLQFLQSRGASSSELIEIVSKVPKILGIKKNKAISVYYDFVKDIVEADKSSKLCHSLPQGSKQENKIRNILVLREVGVPQKLLLSLLTSDAQLVCGREKFQESLKKVVEMGFDPTTSKFVAAMRTYALKEETIEEKVNAYKKLGFSVGDVWKMFKKWPSTLSHSEKKITHKFETLKKCGLLQDEVCSVFKRYPPCIGLSAENVKKKTEFLVKKTNWPLKALVSNPQVLGLSMDKRIVPRCNVIKALISKGLLGKGSELPPLGSVLVCTDIRFLNRYVRKHHHEELVADLMDIFNGGETRKKQLKLLDQVEGYVLSL